MLSPLHIAPWGALQLSEGLIGRGTAAQSASRTPGWNRPRVRHIWVEPDAVLPPPREKSEHFRALQMIFAAKSQLNHAPVGSLQYVDELRDSLEGAGFRPLHKRDLDLSRALNSGYLLRLDVEPKLAGLDPTLGGELGLQQDQPQAEPGAAARSADDEVLWGGRVAVYVRGYSLESTRSRMVLPTLSTPCCTPLCYLVTSPCCHPAGAAQAQLSARVPSEPALARLGPLAALPLHGGGALARPAQPARPFPRLA